MADLSQACAPPLLGQSRFMRPCSRAGRLIFRGGPEAASAAQAGLGFALPREACRAAREARTAALWLGPDEWLLLTPHDVADATAASLAAALAGIAHAIVDVSHRQTGIDVFGPHAEAVLNAGCPLDLAPEAFEVGSCTRTVFGKSQVVLWRHAPSTFRVEVWRSFASYVWALLEQAGREFDFGPGEP